MEIYEKSLNFFQNRQELCSLWHSDLVYLLLLPWQVASDKESDASCRVDAAAEKPDHAGPKWVCTVKSRDSSVLFFVTGLPVCRQIFNGIMHMHVLKTGLFQCWRLFVSLRKLFAGLLCYKEILFVRFDFYSVAYFTIVGFISNIECMRCWLFLPMFTMSVSQSVCHVS